jgi:hypothetical protein
MDYREKAFRDKFASASKHLGVPPDQVISLKLRDVVSSYGEYHEMLRALEQEAGVHWSEVGGNFQGRGYLVDQDGQKIVLVEHETGLEILYVAGSIASLITLIPLVLQCWGTVRGYVDGRHAHQFKSVEIRRFDNNGKLREDHSRGLTGPSAFPLSILNTALSSAARILDTEMHALRKEVRSIAGRLTAIEKQLKPAKRSKTKTKIKTRTDRSNLPARPATR